MENRLTMTENTLSQILIVDDNPDDLNLLAMHLRRANYIVIESETGENCLTLLSQLKPDLVLLDVRMAGIDGFETCRRIKAIPSMKEIPVIFLTSLEDPADKVEGFQVGGVDYIVKPPQPQELFARIENHLALQRSKIEVVELNAQLEELMQKRLVELHNESLWRRQYEQEVAKLLETVRYQGQQLGLLMQFCLGSDSKEADVGKVLLELPKTYLNLLREHLTLAHNHAAVTQDKTAGMLVTEHLSAAMDLLSTLKDQLQQVATQKGRSIETTAQSLGSIAKLSAREQEILRMVANGRSNAEIAQMLSLAEPTVRVYRSRIMGKLQLDDATALIKFAIRHNLTTVN